MSVCKEELADLLTVTSRGSHDYGLKVTWHGENGGDTVNLSVSFNTTKDTVFTPVPHIYHKAKYQE